MTAIENNRLGGPIVSILKFWDSNKIFSFKFFSLIQNLWRCASFYQIWRSWTCCWRINFSVHFGYYFDSKEGKKNTVQFSLFTFQIMFQRWHKKHYWITEKIAKAIQITGFGKKHKGEKKGMEWTPRFQIKKILSAHWLISYFLLFLKAMLKRSELCFWSSRAAKALLNLPK